ncbi:MAG: hypothetical protein HDR01_05910 [Lachnospiraceae bacterium]|nr:hypothetical protein [Lachnospiraceae bacterium]
MTEKEAIEAIEVIKRLIGVSPSERIVSAVNEAISALEKQIPEKPITYKGTNRADCPVCGAMVRGIKEPFGDWCSKCGQALDWSD